MRAPLLLGLALLVGCAPAASPAPPAPAGLRELAEARGLLVGAAVASGPLRAEGAYRDTLAREYNALVPENAMKFAATQPARDRFTFAEADAIVAFAREHHMRVRGHTLVWGNSLPAWLSGGTFSGAGLEAILREHVETEVRHFLGQVYAWDVVNEAVADDGQLKNTLWRRIGPDYLDRAFRWAHEADPTARLFYNDYGGEKPGPKADAMYSLLRGMRERGVPVSGVGLQFHIGTDLQTTAEGYAAVMRRYASLGLEVHVTELDVAVGRGDPDPARLATQAEVYRRVMAACLSVAQCKAVLTWGFTDKHTWLTSYSGHPEAPLPFDAQYQPKPAYEALRAALSAR